MTRSFSHLDHDSWTVRGHRLKRLSHSYCETLKRGSTKKKDGKVFSWDLLTNKITCHEPCNLNTDSRPIIAIRGQSGQFIVKWTGEMCRFQKRPSAQLTLQHQLAWQAADPAKQLHAYSFHTGRFHPDKQRTQSFMVSYQKKKEDSFRKGKTWSDFLIPAGLVNIT